MFIYTSRSMQNTFIERTIIYNSVQIYLINKIHPYLFIKSNLLKSTQIFILLPPSYIHSNYEIYWNKIIESTLIISKLWLHYVWEGNLNFIFD